MTESTTKRNIYIIALIAILVIIALASIQLFKTKQLPEPQPQVEMKIPEVKEEPVIVEEVKAVQPPEPEPIKQDLIEEEVVAPEPVIDEPVVSPLPELNNSDDSINQKLTQYMTKQTLKLLLSDDIIRRLVVYIDNLGKGKIAKKHSPFIEPNTEFSVIDEDILIASPESYERYTPYVALFTSMTAQQAMNIYIEFKPLFDEAYEELGYQERTFDDALFDAIDIVLTTPIVTGNVPLLSETVAYKYAYSEWEQLPDAQKQLLRMGAKNVKKVKQAVKGFKQFLQTNPQ